MNTSIQYKTLTLSPKPFRNPKTFSKAETLYSPNIFDKHFIHLAKPSTTLKDIQLTISNECILISTKSQNPLYSFVWFLN
ncbi:hypothetical protein [uncultured Cytophaga sp.]|uniref:hypothetical protein n=1 Tax=uncultured Cytophaga sp. TaxID=160238 RepID=UPI002603F81F|nr:hypothetical protein [uncultured Cytophaga sp.]